MAHAAAPQGGMEGVAGKRPQRQLDHVVVEFGGGEMEVMQAVENEHGNKRADGADEFSRGQPDDRKGQHHRDLCQHIIRDVMPHRSVDDLDQPPRQRRQLVVAQLPFAAIGQRLDQIEWQIGIEQRRQRRPNDDMQREEGGKGGLRPALDDGDQSRHRLRQVPWVLRKLVSWSRGRPRYNDTGPRWHRP